MAWRKLFSRASTLCATIAVLLLLVSRPADAILLASSSNDASSPRSSLITTLTLANTSTSVAVPTNSVTPMFGHPFRKGDIANGCSGGAPDFRLNDGTTEVPFSESLKPTCWNDGSLKFASFLLRVPNTIPANGTTTIKIYSGGTTPAASGRTLADFTAGGTDLNISISGTGIDSTLIGTWTSDLGQGITAAHSDNYQFMDGQAGAAWRIRASFRQSGTDHGQLEDYWYVTATNDGSNALGGIRYITRLAQPWFDVDPKSYRVLATLTAKNGASLLHDYLNGHFASPQNFAYPGSGDTFTATNNGLQSYWLVYITCSVSCPTGLSARTPYFIHSASTNTFTLATCAQCSTAITPTGAGSGSFTITNYPFISIFGSIFTAASTGRMEYIQGSGSVAADPSIQVKFNNVYWRSTRLLPPFDLESGINPAATGFNLAGQPITYFPQTVNEVAGLVRDVGQTGQSLEMAILPPWGARHFYNQSLTDDNVTRIQALTASMQPIEVRSHVTGLMPCVMDSGATYSPMTCVAGFQVGDVRHTHGFTMVDTIAANQGFTGLDYSHWSANAWYAYLMSGEPEYGDMLREYANNVIYARDYCASCSAVLGPIQQWMGAKRSTRIGGTVYKAFTAWAGNLLRTDAWGMRDLSEAASIVPASDYEGGTGQGSYFKDMAHGNFLAFNAYWPLLDAGTQAMGFWNEVAGNNSINVDAFFLAAVGYSSQINEDADASTFYNYLVRWPKQFHDNNTMFNFSYYSGNDRYTANAYGGTTQFNHYITSLAQFCILTPAPTVTWVSGGHFTRTADGIRNYTFIDGDKFVWERNDTPTKPSAMLFDTPYYAINVSGEQFDLSATPHGSPIMLTDTQATPVPTCMLGANNLAGNLQHQGASSYQYLYGEAMNLGAANGFAVDPATLSDITTRWQSYGGRDGYVSDSNAMPVWSYSSTPY